MMMKTRTLLIAMMAAAALSMPAHAVRHYDILMAGYYNGPSVSGNIGFDDLFQKVPLGVEMGLGYSWTPTGDAILASQVFINQNQVGQNDTQSSGGVMDVALNVTYPLVEKYGPYTFKVYGGPRYARWNVRHEYTNNNEDFDVNSYVWGLGAGLRGQMPLGDKFALMLQLGLDYYWHSSIYGHDATYYPDGTAVNARNNGQGYTYTYDDALRATTVPHIRPRVMVGFEF